MAGFLNSVRLRFRTLLRREQLEADLRDEIAHHLAMRETQLRGSGAAHATAQARQRFGSVAKIQEELRDTWTFAPRLRSVAQDLRYAARSFRHSPGFAVFVVLALGLGIGTNTAFFSIVDAAFIRPLGYANADRLVALHEAFPDSSIHRWPFSPLDFEDLRRYQEAFDAVAAYRTAAFELSGDGSPEHLQGARVSGSLWRTLGVTPIVGRAFSEDEDRLGTHVAILSWGLWHRRYGGDPSIVGERIELDRQPYTVVGVMPRAFVFPRRGPAFNNEPAAVWVPLAFRPTEQVERATNHAYSVIARLKPGVSLDMAQAHLDLLGRRLAEEYSVGLRNAGFTPRLSTMPLREEISGRFRRPLLMLFAAGWVVLLVACANVANLVLTRAAGRRRELTVRVALGAGTARLAQLLLCEGVLLSFAGGALGVGLAYWSVKAAPVVLAQLIPGLEDVALDVRVLAFAVTTCVAISLLFALLPLASLDRSHPGDSLREDTTRAAGSRHSRRMQQGFVVSAVGLACVLLVGAGLLLRSFSALMAVDLGFRHADVATVSITLPQTGYQTPASVRRFQDALLGALSSMPGVRSASLASDLPLTSAEIRRFEPEGSAIAGHMTPMTRATWVAGRYFETFGMTLREGRFFTEEEHVENRRVVIVNTALAERFWPGDQAVGKRLIWGSTDSAYPWLTVVGVVNNVRATIGSDPEPHAYEPFRQLPSVFLGRTVNAAVLAERDVRGLPARIRTEVARIDAQLAIESLDVMEQRVNDALASRRFSTSLVTACAAGALLLTWIGLYGLLALRITERRREIAVRLAFGAGRDAVGLMVLGEGARLVALGLVAGVGASLVLVRLVPALLYDTSHYDVVTFVAAPLAVAVAALLACAMPAWRAANVEPARALRGE